MIIITLTYDCKGVETTSHTERKPKTFENRICGTIYDETKNNRRKRYNRELYKMVHVVPVTSFIKKQRPQWPEINSVR